jgi:hypothetical protein
VTDTDQAFRIDHEYKWYRAIVGIAFFSLPAAIGLVSDAPWPLALILVHMSGAMLVLIAAGLRRNGQVLLRVDASGVLIGRLFKSELHIPWAEVEALVAWPGKKGHWCGARTTEPYRARMGLRSATHQVFLSETHRPSATARFHTAAAHFAPHLPLIDLRAPHPTSAEA